MNMVELMIGMLLAMVLAGSIIAVFVNSSHSFKQDENVLRMQDDARYALREIAFDISMAGHYAELLVPSSITADGSLSILADCGPVGQDKWMYRTTQAGTGDSFSLIAIDNATAGTAAAVHSCIANGELLDGTDVVSVKRVAGSAAGLTRAGAIYLRTNGTVGLLYRAPFPGVPLINIPAPQADWEFRPRIYYVRQYANTPGDGVPTLCRKVLAGVGPSMTTECIATGIENLQLEYGIDTNDDGSPNVFLNSPTLAQMQGIVSVRIYLLARTAAIDTRYTNQKTFSLSNSPDYTPADSFHRRVFSTTVSVQNIRSMNMMGF